MTLCLVAVCLKMGCGPLSVGIQREIRGQRTQQLEREVQQIEPLIGKITSCFTCPFFVHHEPPLCRMGRGCDVSAHAPKGLATFRRCFQATVNPAENGPSWTLFVAKCVPSTNMGRCHPASLAKQDMSRPHVEADDCSARIKLPWRQQSELASFFLSLFLGGGLGKNWLAPKNPVLGDFWETQHGFTGFILALQNRPMERCRTFGRRTGVLVGGGESTEFPLGAWPISGSTQPHQSPQGCHSCWGLDVSWEGSCRANSTQSCSRQCS